MFCWRDFARVSWGCPVPFSLVNDTVVQGVDCVGLRCMAVEDGGDLTLILWL